jgi:organic radical activating enzyme
MITATPEQDAQLYEPSNCGCYECQTKMWLYPYELGAATRFARSYINNHQLTFITNADCNINCRHCFCPSAFPGQPEGFISKEIIDKGFDLIKNYKMVVSILGGEVMLYPENCKYIADKAHEYGHDFRLITNGFFGDDDKLVNFVLDEIKPEILTISVDEFHQEFIPIETIKALIDKCYGKTEIVLESCMNVPDNVDFIFDRQPRITELEETLGLQKKKIFYLVDAIVKDGNAIDNDLGFTKDKCKPGHCSACGIVISPHGNISIKCEFNSRPILPECKAWVRNILTDDFNFEDLLKFINTKRYWMDDKVLSELDSINHSDKYLKYDPTKEYFKHENI